jgi:hypothetical protein
MGWIPIRTRNKKQQCPDEQYVDSLQAIDRIGGGGRTRTDDLGIMRPSL